jgi:hypothetical protein
VRIARRAAVVSALALALAAPAALAAPPTNHVVFPPRTAEQGRLLGEWWSAVLVQPLPDNPFVGAGDLCLDLAGGSVVAPVFLPGGERTCTVKAGTRIFVMGLTNECSTIEEPPYFARTPAEGRRCAHLGLRGVTDVSIIVDGGRRIRLSPNYGVESPWVTMDVPEGNVLSGHAGTASFLAWAYVALLRPLPVGRHTLHLTVTGAVLPAESDEIIEVVP